MEKDEDENFVKTFDEFYTTNHIQIMKSLLPYLSSNARETIPVLIKFLEFQDALQKKKEGCSPWNCIVTPKEIDHSNLINIYQVVQKYLSPDEDHICQQIIQLKSQIENMKQMQQMFELFQEMDLSSLNQDQQEVKKDEATFSQDTDKKEDHVESNMDMFKLLQFLKDIS